MLLARIAVVIGLWSALSNSAYAAISYSSIGSTYTQDFDTLAIAGDGDLTTNSSVAGWSLFRITNKDDPTPVPVSTYEASDGQSDNGRFFSYGATGISERALGAIGRSGFGEPGNTTGIHGNGLIVGWIALSLTNNTGTTLTEFTLRYDGEQWRDADNGIEPESPQTMTAEFGFGSTFNGVNSWSAAGSAFNFTSLVNTAASGPVDGNGAGRVSNLGGTISGLTWAPGTTLWFRWVEFNDLVIDHGLAIDNVSFIGGPVAVPEANAFLCGAFVAAIATLVAQGARLFRILRPR